MPPALRPLSLPSFGAGTGHFLPRPHIKAQRPHVPRPGTGDWHCDDLRLTLWTGNGTGVGEGITASKERRRPLQRRPRTRPRQSKWEGVGGGEWKLEREGKRAMRKRQGSGASVDAGRWSPKNGEKLAIRVGANYESQENLRTTLVSRGPPRKTPGGRGSARHHRKRKPSTAFRASMLGKYSRVLTGLRGREWAGTGAS